MVMKIIWCILLSLSDLDVDGFHRKRIFNSEKITSEETLTDGVVQICNEPEARITDSCSTEIFKDI